MTFRPRKKLMNSPLSVSQNQLELLQMDRRKRRHIPICSFSRVRILRVGLEGRHGQLPVSVGQASGHEQGRPLARIHHAELRRRAHADRQPSWSYQRLPAAGNCECNYLDWKSGAYSIKRFASCFT